MADNPSPSEIVRLKNENARLKARIVKSEQPKSLRRIFLEAIFGGSLMTATVAGGYKVYTDYTAPKEGGITRAERRCDQAHRAIIDDRLSADLEVADRKAYMLRQARIAEVCDKDDKS